MALKTAACRDFFWSFVRGGAMLRSPNTSLWGEVMLCCDELGFAQMSANGTYNASWESITSVRILWWAVLQELHRSSTLVLTQHSLISVEIKNFLYVWHIFDSHVAYVSADYIRNLHTFWKLVKRSFDRDRSHNPSLTSQIQNWKFQWPPQQWHSLSSSGRAKDHKIE